MLTVGLQPCRNAQHRVLIPSQRVVRHKPWPAFGQGACLVESDRIDAVRLLQSFCILDEDAVFGGDAGPGHDRGRRRQAERAGTGDYQNGNGIEDGLRPVAREQAPAHQGGQGREQHYRNEHGGDAIHQALDWRLVALCGLDQSDNPRQGRLVADGGCFDHDQAFRVDRSPCDL